jgi:TPR repeat protein
MAALVATSAAFAGGVVLTARHETSAMLTTTSCELDKDVIRASNENSEAERFADCLAFHRCFWEDYKQRWAYAPDANRTPTTSASAWPAHVPVDHEVPSLEMDYGFCQRSLQKKSRYCDDLQFQLAAYKLRHDDPEIRRDGFKLVKQLAEKGHGDGMCMYGIVLNEGKVVEADPTQATVWWQRAVDMHRHVQSTYELAVAFFTGEGVVENEELAVIYFEKAATMGHAGAAYMLGDCLLDGVGTPRDRAEALEWLVAAGELGHRGARSRVLAVLELEDGADYGRFTDASRQTLVDDVNALVEDVEEESKWQDDSQGRGKEPMIVSIERRFTIGGGSRNPVVLARRRTVVAESRGP